MMKINELAAYLEVFTIRQLYDMVHKKEIPFTNDGKHIFFDKDKIDEWNEKRLQRLSQEKDYFTLQEVCNYTGLKKNTIYQYTKLDEIPHYHSGRYLRFKKNKIYEWTKNREK